MKNINLYNIIRVFNKTAFENNLKIALNKFHDKLGIVVKSNAYGIGIENILPICTKNKILNYFCQDIIEALEIKQILKDNKYNIFTFSGVMDGQEKYYTDNNIIPICINLNQIISFNNYLKIKNLKTKIGIHFDTGMNRTGLSFTETEILSKNWNEYTSNLDVILYISHLHTSYTKNKSNEKQLTKLNKILSILPKRQTSLSATGGSFVLDNNYHFDLLRIGYGLYGFAKDMEIPQTVYAKILQTRTVQKGETIGYFGSFKAKNNMKIAVINIGYNDGYIRGLSHTNKIQDKIRKLFKSGANFTTSYMTIADKYKCKVIGIISMNNTIIDVSNIPDEILNKTNYVEVIGKNTKITDFRNANGFIPIELLTSLMKPNPNAIDINETEFKKLKII